MGNESIPLTKLRLKLFNTRQHKYSTRYTFPTILMKPSRLTLRLEPKISVLQLVSGSTFVRQKDFPYLSKLQTKSSLFRRVTSFSISSGISQIGSKKPDQQETDPLHSSRIRCFS